MKIPVFIALFLVFHNLGAQSEVGRADRILEVWTKTLNLDGYQQKKAQELIQRKLDNETDIAFLQDKEPETFYLKKQAIVLGVNTSLAQFLSDQQRTTYYMILAAIRQKKAELEEGWKTQGLGQEQIKRQLTDLESVWQETFEIKS